MPKTKAILLWFLFLALICDKSAAQQYDKVWVLGDYMSSMTFIYDSVIIGQLPDTTLQSFLTMGDICDANGKLLFYTNGVNVYNITGNVMVNGDSLSSPSEYYNQVVQGGMPSREGVVIIPMPGDTNLYYIFHYTPTDTLDITDNAGYVPLNLYYSIVDMRADSGRGALTSKNVPIIQNELLSCSRLSACKHANGRDWWIVKPAWYENIYYEFLLTPEGVQGPFIQQIGPLYGRLNDQGSYSSFSPDGSKYVSLTDESYVVLMDFDRCTGLFSNPESIINYYPYLGGSSFSGGFSAVFSPSVRFLYVCNRLQINQYDLLSSRINDSVRIVTLTDYTDTFQMNIMQLAPNGKIYISTWNGGRDKIHVINQPDSLGLACDFQLYGQPVLTDDPFNLPYFPNYRLGPLVGSGCDTINGVLTPALSEGEGVRVSPDPVVEEYRLRFVDPVDMWAYKDLHFSLYDLTGRLVMDVGITGQETILHRGELMDGMYLWHVLAGGKNLYEGKMVFR